MTPWIQPWRPVAAAPAGGPPLPAGLDAAPAHVADVPAAGSVAALPADGWSLDPWTWVLGLAVAGTVVRLAWLGAGLVRLGRLARADHRVAPPEAARELLARLGVSAAFVQPPDVRMPCSFGLFRPTVVLPPAFGGLDPAFQRAVVCHELVHIGRRDFAGAMLEEVAAALLWFHPWAWLIRRRIRLHREQVVDAAVVRCTGDRRAYVRCLVALAGHPRALAPAAPMLRTTELRARTDALFEKEGAMSKRRSAVLATGLCAALGAAVWTAATAVPLRAAPAPPDPAAVTVAVGAAAAPPSAPRTGPTTQEPRTSETASPTLNNILLLEFTLPGGQLPRMSSPEGELTSVTLNAGTLGFVARRRGSAGGVVTVTVFDMDSDPDRELGAVDVTVGGEPVTFQGPVPIEIAVPGIVYSVSVGGSLPDGSSRLARMARAIAENLSRGDEPEQAAAGARTAAVMAELQQALAAMADRLGNDETAAGELAQPFAELQERFAELQELLAGR